MLGYLSMPTAESAAADQQSCTHSVAGLVDEVLARACLADASRLQGASWSSIGTLRPVRQCTYMSPSATKSRSRFESGCDRGLADAAAAVAAVVPFGLRNPFPPVAPFRAVLMFAPDVKTEDSASSCFSVASSQELERLATKKSPKQEGDGSGGHRCVVGVCVASLGCFLILFQ